MTTISPSPPPDGWRDQLAALIGHAPINLVSRSDRPHVRRLHIDECVAIARDLEVRAGERWMDLGTGGGLPGLVLAATFPGTHWTLVDARAKKIRHVDGFARRLHLRNVDTAHGRGEVLADTPAFRGAFDGVTTRAVGSLERSVALSRGFVDRGQIIAIRGRDALLEAEAMAPWLDDLGVESVAVQRIEGTIRATWLIRFRGLGRPPAHFPQVRRQLLRSARGGTLDSSR